ncbi:MAG: helicase, partial [bacterium]
MPKEERDERLEYLMFLRHFRDTNPEWFKKILNQVPHRARTGRKDKTRKHHTIAYIKNNKRDCFYYIYGDLHFDELTFVEAVKVFKADVSERPVPLHDKHHEQISAAVRSFQEQVDLQALGARSSIKLGPNDQRAIAVINDMMKQEFANDMEKEKMEAAKVAIKIGKFQKLPREINKLLKQAKEQLIPRLEMHQQLMRILNRYPLLEEGESAKGHELHPNYKVEKNQPQIIISESFI